MSTLKLTFHCNSHRIEPLRPNPVLVATYDKQMFANIHGNTREHTYELMMTIITFRGALHPKLHSHTPIY